MVTNSIASNNAIRIENELDSNSERIRCTELGCCVRILEALDPDMDPSRNQRAGTLNHIGPDCDSQFELDWIEHHSRRLITMMNRDDQTIDFD